MSNNNNDENVKIAQANLPFERRRNLCFLHTITHCLISFSTPKKHYGFANVLHMYCTLYFCELQTSERERESYTRATQINISSVVQNYLLRRAGRGGGVMCSCCRGFSAECCLCSEGGGWNENKRALDSFRKFNIKFSAFSRVSSLARCRQI